MNFKKIVMPVIVRVLFGVQLVGCSSQPVKPGSYDAAEIGKVNKVEPGIIVSMRPVNIHNKTEANGTDVAGTDTSIVRSHGFEYVVKLSNGAIISLVQTEDAQLKNKQHILVIYGGNTRIVPDNGSDES
jgi:outer membrane lipoprotein SlyB